MIATLAALLVIPHSVEALKYWSVEAGPNTSTLQSFNTLTPGEQLGGWKLLFDGKTTAGWHNFKSKTIGEGWKVENGNLVCADYKKAGDIMTDEQFDWFELILDFNMGKGENSGIMFRVTEQGDATWHTGPEVQLYDNKEAGVQKTGWLYQIYQSDVDSARPAGQWNHLRILLSKENCRTILNGVKYYEYIFGSEDFWARVNKGKFKEFPYFAKAAKGSIAIQGDHGKVSFRNIKIRPIK